MQQADDDKLTDLSVQKQFPQRPPDDKVADLFVRKQLVLRPSAQGGYSWAARRT